MEEATTVKLSQETPSLLKTVEACEYLRISRAYLFRLAARGKIKRTWIGKALRWSRGVLDDYVRANTGGRSPRQSRGK